MGVAVAAVVTIAVVVAYRRVQAWLSFGQVDVRLVGDLAATLSLGCTPAMSVRARRRFGRDVIGVREYQGQLVAVIAVDGKADGPSGRHQREMVAHLPVAVVAAALQQFDVHLDAIDIVSVRRRDISEAADPSVPATADDRPAGIEGGHVAGVDGS